MGDLDLLREKIDYIDKQIVNLFEERLNICKEIGRIKKDNNLPIFNQERENKVIEQNSSLIQEEYKNSYIKLIKLIIEESKKVQ